MSHVSAFLFRLTLALGFSQIGCETIVTAVGEGGDTSGTGGSLAVGGSFASATTAAVGGSPGECQTPAPVGMLTFGPGSAVAATTGAGGESFECFSGVQDEAGHVWISDCTDSDGCSCLYDDVEMCACVGTDTCTTTCCPYPWNAPV